MCKARKFVRVIAANVLLMTAIITGPAHAQVTGERWMKLCLETSPLADRISCGSYARGVADMVQIMQQSAPEVAKACIPYDKSGNDLAITAFPFIAEPSSNDRDKPASILLWGAWMQVYPCR